MTAMTNKNYKVRCCRLGYWGQEKLCVEHYYDWYWAADLRSWVMRHLFGMSCNTFVRDGAKVKPRAVVWK